MAMFKNNQYTTLKRLIQVLYNFDVVISSLNVASEMFVFLI
jgi:hypothetical protein